MSKPLVLVTAPVATRSGYGNHSRDICQALIESDKYDVRINPVRWGNTPMNALETENKAHFEIYKRLLTEPTLDRQPDLHMHIVIPNEFTPLGKKNIGVTAGIEHTNPPAESRVVVATLTRLPLSKLRSKTSVPASNPEMVPPMEPGSVRELGPASQPANHTVKVNKVAQSVVVGA